MTDFEERPRQIWETATMIVFSPKASGGARPIALMPLLLRLRCRLRQPLRSSWEAARDRPFFWGRADRGCEKAGWLHNALASRARSAGMAAGPLFLDIEKLYENLGHEALWAAAQEHGFNLKLLRGLLVS